ncbi:MAG: hypothetical protein ACLP50_09525 [Solirubrobacteraceae bacterium]
MDSQDLKADLELSLGREPFTAERLALLKALAAIYEHEGVIRDGEALPLWGTCRCRTSCWRGIPDERKPGCPAADSDLGAIPLPWVGQHYSSGGVAVLAINLNNASGLYVEYENAWHQLTTFETGGKRPQGSPLPYGSAQAAAAVLRSRAGKQELLVDDSRELVNVLDSIARVQAIKCSVSDHRSTRTPAMRANCPPRYLPRELALLKPSVLISLGDEPWSAMEPFVVDEPVWGDHFSRSILAMDGAIVEMFWLHHPSGPNELWKSSLQLLIENLRNCPASPPACDPR